MSANSTRPDSEKGVGPARRPSTRRIGASKLRDKPTRRSLRLKQAAIWGMSVYCSHFAGASLFPETIAHELDTFAFPNASP